MASAVPQANGEAPPLPDRRGRTPAKSPSPLGAGDADAEAAADAVKSEADAQVTNTPAMCDTKPLLSSHRVLVMNGSCHTAEPFPAVVPRVQVLLWSASAI